MKYKLITNTTNKKKINKITTNTRIQEIVTRMIFAPSSYIRITHFRFFLFTARRFLYSILSPSFRALQSDLIPEEVRRKEFGVVQAAYNLGSVIGPILGGWLYDIFFGVSFSIGEFEFIGAGITFAFSGILAILASVLLLLYVNPKDLVQLDISVETDSQPQI